MTDEPIKRYFAEAVPDAPLKTRYVLVLRLWNSFSLQLEIDNLKAVDVFEHIFCDNENVRSYEIFAPDENNKLQRLWRMNYTQLSNRRREVRACPRTAPVGPAAAR